MARPSWGDATPQAKARDNGSGRLTSRLLELVGCLAANAWTATVSGLADERGRGQLLVHDDVAGGGVRT
jgi:hypothetical protein